MQFAPTRVPDKLPCLGRGRPYMYQAKFAGGLETPPAKLPCLGRGPFDALVTRHDHLRDAVAIVDRERRVGEVGEDDTDLSAIIGVDRAGRVQDGDSVLDGQPAVWADLRLIAGWEFDADYQIPSAQKIGVATSYAGATNGTPFTNDFPKALAIG